MNKYLYHIIFLFVFFCAKNLQAQNTTDLKYLSFKKDGTVLYIPDETGNIIPDFSKVGYQNGSKELPVIKVKKIVKPGSGNDQEAIQAAIDAVSIMPVDKNGFRGAVLLQQGTYTIAGTIKITSSGIVLRGEGEATKIIAAGKGQRTLISVSGAGSIKEVKGSRQKITQTFVPSGAKNFTVTDAKKYKVGDSIIVFRPGTEQWINDLKMNHIDVRDSNTKQWRPKEYDLHFERVITAIQANTIYLDNPIVMQMEEKYGGGEIYKYHYNGRISNIGIENLYCQSEYTHDKDEDHGWDAIKINKAQNGWVKNVTAVNFGYSCVNLGNESRNITVTDCKSLDPKSKIEGGRRYSFNNDGQMNLFANCFASNGRHDYVTGAQVRGPNVFYNCVAEKTHADIGPHHRWAMGTLYDNIITDGEINSQDRGNWGTGHGWSAVNQVFWNCSAKKAAIQNPWVTGINYVLKMNATPYDGRLKGRNASAWYGKNDSTLKTTSLYKTQLLQRKRSKK